MITVHFVTSCIDVEPGYIKVLAGLLKRVAYRVDGFSFCYT